MGIFTKKRPVATPAPKSAPPPQVPEEKPRLSTMEKSRIDGYPKLQKKMQDLEKRLQFQEQEIQEQEQYLRSTLGSLNTFRRQSRFQEGEIAEQEAYLRQVSEHLTALQGQKDHQNRELQEVDQYLRELHGMAGSLRKKDAFQEDELRQYDDHLRQVMDSYSKVQHQKQFQEQEIQELENYLRKLTDSYSKVQHQKQFQEQEIQELENYLRQVTEGFQSLQKTHRDQAEQNDRLVREMEQQKQQFEADRTRLEANRDQDVQNRSVLQEQLSDLEMRLQETAEHNRNLQSDLFAREQEISKHQKGLDHPIPMIELDRSGIIVSANPAFERLTGYSAEELIGKHERLTLQFREDDTLRYDNLWSRVSQGFPQTATFTLFSRDGREVHAETEYMPATKGAEGIIVKWIKETADQNQLQESLRALTEGVDDLLPILHFDLDGRISHMNKRMKELLGIQNQQSAGARFQELLTAEDRQSVSMLHLFEFLRAGEPITRSLMFRRQPSGVVPIRVSLQPVQDMRHQVREVVMVGRMITPDPHQVDTATSSLIHFLREMRQGGSTSSSATLGLDPGQLRELEVEIGRFLQAAEYPEPPPTSAGARNMEGPFRTEAPREGGRYLSQDSLRNWMRSKQSTAGDHPRD